MEDSLSSVADHSEGEGEGYNKCTKLWQSDGNREENRYSQLNLRGWVLHIGQQKLRIPQKINRPTWK